MSGLWVLAALVVSASLTRWFSGPTGPFHILDHSAHRSLHDHPTPRSGGVALLAAAVPCGVLGAMAGHAPFTLLSLVPAGAACGSPLFNFPRARIFTGELGASTLGFLAAALAQWADRDRVFPLRVAVFVLSPFFVDVTVMLLRRALKGEKVWDARRSRFYQRLVLLGWSHCRTVLWEYRLMAACTL